MECRTGLLLVGHPTPEQHIPYIGLDLSKQEQDCLALTKHTQEAIIEAFRIPSALMNTPTEIAAQLQAFAAAKKPKRPRLPKANRKLQTNRQPPKKKRK